MHRRIIHLFYPQSGYMQPNSSLKKNDEQPTLLECFYPQAEVEDPQLSILKQKAGIPSKVVLNKIEELFSSSPTIGRDLFSQSDDVTKSYRHASTISCIHTSFIIYHGTCITHITFSFIWRASLSHALMHHNIA